MDQGPGGNSGAFFFINTLLNVFRGDIDLPHIFLPKKELVLVGIVYYRLDFTHLLNEFYYQTEDYVPDIPGVHKFLNYWKNEIQAVIKSVEVSCGSSGFRTSKFYETLQ